MSRREDERWEALACMVGGIAVHLGGAWRQRRRGETRIIREQETGRGDQPSLLLRVNIFQHGNLVQPK